MTIEEKIRLIETSSSFAEVPAEAMPASHKENYYFVSYSHRDYKEVLKDILRLEELGVNIWYDNEMHIGENWREIAQMYISKFQCSGVIFYLTENSISSPACNQEVEYVLTHNKGFLSINKALDGCSVQSGHAMLKVLKERGLSCSDELMANFERAFSDEVLYLSMDATAEQKARKINEIQREELLDVRLQENGWKNRQQVLAIHSCKDNTIISIDLSKKHEVDGVIDNIGVIGDCVFTNATKLQSVRLPRTLKQIGESAFRNCTSLSDINLSDIDGLDIGNNAFRGCTVLGHVDLSRVAYIGENAFRECFNLTIGPVNGSIGEGAFKDTHIKRIDYISRTPQLERSAFFACTKLEEFNVQNKFRYPLHDSAFYACRSLKKAGPFITDGDISVQVESGVFGFCESLESIRFIGQWKFDDAYSAFCHCTALSEIELNIADTVIPDNFAEECVNLQKITNAPRFTVIGDSAFKGCRMLSALDLSAVTELGRGSFRESGIENAYLKNVHHISKEAFYEAKKLKTVYIGAECEQIDADAFFSCLSLTTVKILSKNARFDTEGAIFPLTDIKCFYLSSRETLELLIGEGVINGLRYLYVDEGVNLCGIDLSVFEQVESDEMGFYKFLQDSVYMTEDADDADPTSDEINEPDSKRKKLPLGPDGITLPFNDVSRMVGNDYEIKHSRLQSPRTYFIEDVVTDGDAIDYMSVSLHTGKSFKLDGSLIVTIRPEYEPPRSQLSVDSPDELDGKSCCIMGDGVFKYCTVTGISVYSMPKAHEMFCRPVQDENGKYAIEAVFYYEDGRKKAISALDIDTITVFNSSFEVEKIYKNQN